MSAVIDKVIALHNLQLPYDVVEEINRCCFYDKIEVGARNAKEIANRKIRTAFHDRYYFGQWWFQAGYYDTDAEIHEPQFQSSNCTTCGNYYHGNNIADAAPTSICVCIVADHNIGWQPEDDPQQDAEEEPEQHAQQEPDDIYWIDDDSIVDPDETAYAEGRNDYMN
jgi:hypothetical protein